MSETLHVLERNKTFRKVSVVLLPIVFLAGVLNYIDRTNLTFAALELNKDLGFTPVDYGVAAGAFSLGYGVAHLPSTLLTMRLGARVWYSAMTIAWGVAATSAAAVTDSTGLCVQRFLLGVAEAGAIPSAIHLLSQFYPKSMATKPFTAVTLANVVSVVFAAPLAAGLMSIQAGNLKGWQWLFILEGIPSVLLGLAMLVVVPDGPRTAWFLHPEERAALHLAVHGSQEEADAATQKLQWSQVPLLVLQAARMPLLWYFAFAGLLWVLCVFSLNAWIAIIIKSMLTGTVLTGSTAAGGASSARNLQATLLSAIPYSCAAVGMWAMACSSHHFREKDFHVGVPWLVGGLGLFFFEPLFRRAFAAGFAVIIAALALAYSSQSVMFARVTESLDTKHAGVGVSIFNAVGAAIGGFLGPLVVGALVQRLGSFVSAITAMSAFLTASGVMMAGLGVWNAAACTQRGVRRRRRRQSPPASRAGSQATTASSAADLLGTVPGPSSSSSGGGGGKAGDVELVAPPLNPRAHSIFKM